MLLVQKAWIFCQKLPVSEQGKKVFTLFSTGTFANVCKMKDTEIPRRSCVRYMQVDECKAEEEEYAFAVAGEAQGGKIVVNIGGILV